MPESDGSETINLNRLTFFENNKVPRTCPTFVIEFLARSSGIKYDFTEHAWASSKTEVDLVIHAIQQYSKDKVNVLRTSQIDSRLRDLALFVNPFPDVQWKSKELLLKAFWSIYNFTPKLPLAESASFGCKTDEDPYRIDPIMSYLVAVKYGIPTSRETSIDALNAEIINYSINLTPMRESILSKISRLSRKGLVEIYNHFKSESPTSEGRKYPSELDISADHIAKHFRWDVSNSRYPEQEYKTLDSVPEDKYSPYDPDWRIIFNVNRRYFNLDFRYIEAYDHLYDEDKKKLLIYKNGGSKDTGTLVTGVHPFYRNLSLGDSEVPLVTVIGMEGVPHDALERYDTILSTRDFLTTRDELVDLWSEARAFISPINPSVEFSDSQLKMITLNSDAKHPIVKFIHELKTERESLVDRGLLYCVKDELMSNVILTKVLTLGMTIRGYNICYDQYPLSESSYDIGMYQDQIEEESGRRGMYLLENHKDFLKNIPLLTGRNSLGPIDNKININTYGKGKSLLDGISDIFKNACIRTNSNYLLVTSWYYLKQINNKSPFNLGDLRFIS